MNQINSYEESIQILPSNRKVWKILLLCIVTLGIYGFAFLFTVIKETNVACKEDGKHTREFWGLMGLSIITLGIYGIVWTYKCFNREYAYLQRHNNRGYLSGERYLVDLGLSFFMGVVKQLIIILLYLEIVSFSTYSVTSFGCGIIQLIIAISLMASYIRQHNMVCRIYNDINNLVRQA